jgi:glucokinase
MDFGGTNIKTGLFEEDGRIIRFDETELMDFTDKGELLNNLINHARNFCTGMTPEKGGLAIKGLVNTKAGVVEEDIGAGSLLAGVNLREAFSKGLGIPFFVENDARSYAWGEWKFGAGQGSKVMVCMTLGTGLGCALVVNGVPYEGSNPLGGILGGHISIDRNGLECLCGNRGCLEQYCSATALTKRVKNAHPELEKESEILPKFFEFIKQNNQKYHETLLDFQQDLAIGIVNVIHAYGPDTIVLGGGVMNSSDQILPGLIKIVHKMAWTFPRSIVRLYPGKLGNKAAALGVSFHPGLK